MKIDEFFLAVDSDDLKSIDRAIYLLWFVGREDIGIGPSARDLCDVMERNGHPKQNVSRMDEAIGSDRRTAKAAAGSWRLVPKSRRDLDAKFATVVTAPKRVAATDAVLPHELFKGTRGYLEDVVRQVNASYDYGLYDCCAVMCRRLLETLLIEVYEAGSRSGEVKGADGNFFMFASLLAFFEKDPTLNARAFST